MTALFECCGVKIPCGECDGCRCTCRCWDPEPPWLDRWSDVDDEEYDRA